MNESVLPKRSGFREIEVVAELVVNAYRYVSGVIPNVEYSCPCFVIARKAFSLTDRGQQRPPERPSVAVRWRLR
jgi:hypothetical protein